MDEQPKYPEPFSLIGWLIRWTPETGWIASHADQPKELAGADAILTRLQREAALRRKAQRGY